MQCFGAGSMRAKITLKIDKSKEFSCDPASGQSPELKLRKRLRHENIIYIMKNNLISFFRT
jgi:hypothetical protein